MLKNKQNYQRKVNSKKISTKSLVKNAISSGNAHTISAKPPNVQSNYQHSSTDLHDI